MEHKGTITIETKRLVLRAFVIEDAPLAFANWESDDNVTEFLRWQTYHSVDAVKEVLAEWVENYADKSFYHWAIVLKEINEPIGTISAVDMDEKPTKCISVIASAANGGIKDIQAKPLLPLFLSFLMR